MESLTTSAATMTLPSRSWAKHFCLPVRLERHSTGKVFTFQFSLIHALRGDTDAAITKAREGITFADAGGLWFQAAMARAALIDVLVQANATAEEVQTVIAEARELVARSGGNSLLPRCAKPRQCIARWASLIQRIGWPVSLKHK